MIYNHGRHEIEFFDSIHNLPILRFQRFNKYQMQASEIGSTFEDYDHRTQKAIQFLKKDMNAEAAQELENRRQTVFNAYNEFSPQLKSLAILVKRINNKEYTTFAPDDLDRCLKHLDKIGLGQNVSLESLQKVKKKSKPNFQFITKYFSQKAKTKKE